MTKHETKTKDELKAGEPLAPTEGVQDNTSLAQTGQGATLAERNTAVVDYGEDAGAGFENQTQDDVGLPFVDILQPQSPEVANAPEGSPVRGGWIINRITGETWPGAEKGIVFVPAITEHCYVEWKPKKGPNGELLPGGFVARHELTEEIVQKARAESAFKTYRMPNGNDLQETFYVYAIQINEDGSTAPIVMAFSSSKIQAYKQFSYVARAIQVLASVNPPKRVNPPLFAHAYRYTTLKKTRDTQTWFIPVLDFANKDAEGSRLLPTDAIYLAARAMKDGLLAGTVKVDYTKTTTDQSAGAGDPPPF